MRERGTAPAARVTPNHVTEVGFKRPTSATDSSASSVGGESRYANRGSSCVWSICGVSVSARRSEPV